MHAGDGKHILLMDDDAAVREVVTGLLESSGYRVAATMSGEEAVDAYQGGGFDAVLLDLHVPGGMGGRDTVQCLMGIDPGVRAVVVTGSTSDPAFVRFADFGFLRALAKPFSCEELLDAVRSVVSAP